MIHEAFERGEGILRLVPTWVPRVFCIPGKRIKLHQDDLYAFGAHRGGIDERWFSSTTKADNGPLTTPDEGLSYVVHGDGADPQKTLFVDLVAELGATLLGDDMWNKYHAWPMYSKFFDNKGALPHHLHQMQEHAARVGMQQKPETYYFPRQLNNYGADFPYTLFGLEPGTTRDQVHHCLEIWNQGDNHITDLSKAYRLELGTGWYVPAGVYMRRAAFALMNHNGLATSLRCSSHWSMKCPWIGRCWCRMFQKISTTTWITSCL